MKIRYVGFWFKNNTPHPYPSSSSSDLDLLPLKVVKSSNQPNDPHLIEKLKEIQKIAGVRKYIGFSPCRLCNQQNYANEYFIDSFVFPRGYLHYLEDHHVPFDPYFQIFVQNFSFDQKHDTKFSYQYHKVD